MTARGSLAQRISLLAVAVAVITGAVAGLLSVGLTRTVSESSARKELKNVATLAVQFGYASPAKVGQRVKLIAPANIKLATLDASGNAAGGARLAVDAANALTAAQRRKLLASGTLSLRTSVDGTTVFIESRTTRNGGILLVQRRADALALADEAIRRVVIALLVGVIVAVLLGLLVAFGSPAPCGEPRRPLMRWPMATVTCGRASTGRPRWPRSARPSTRWPARCPLPRRGNESS